MTTQTLPDSVRVTIDGGVAFVRLSRAAKRNALDDATVLGLEQFFTNPPDGVRAAVLHPDGDHFSAGLDLAELRETTTFEGVEHSSMWHRAFRSIEFGRVPVVSVLTGAVIGGGLELATATHIRVAEPSAFYALPEGRRGLFVGGGASVRVSRLIGASRMADMMLTGRVLDAEDGHRYGLSHYLVDEGAGLTRATELARTIADNTPVTNYAVMHVLPRIAETSPTEGYVMESLIAAISQGSDDTKQRLAAFLDGRADKVAR